jgi:hypothetical protein
MKLNNQERRVMSKISLQIEADSAEEYLMILTFIVPRAVVARINNDWAAPFNEADPEEVEHHERP